MSKWHLPRAAGFVPFPEEMCGPGETIQLICPAGYGYRHCAGGLILYPRWWLRLAEWSLDLTPLHFIAAVALCYWTFRIFIH